MLYAELFADHLKQLKTGELSTAVEVLIEKAFGLSRSQFWIRKNQPVRDAAGLRRFRGYFARLLADEPLAYIMKEKEFFGEAFVVGPAVLIPRPETELLVEKALELIGKKTGRVLDIGAGSGNISIVMALRSAAAVTAVEKSRSAVRTLNKNIARHGLQSRIRVVAADLYPGPGPAFDLILANPPYLSAREWDELPAGIRLFEPRSALVAGPAGTEALAGIIAGAHKRLAPTGHLLLEIGHGQLRPVRAFLKAARLREAETIRDYAGIPRVIVARR